MTHRLPGLAPWRGRRNFALLLFLLLALLPATVSAADWPTFHGDNTRQGDDSTDTGLVNPQPAWTSAQLDGQIYAEPLVVGGQVIVATENDSVYSLNAANGQPQWHTNLGTPRTTAIACGDIKPQGITSTPVIDGGSIYVVANIQTGSSSFYFDLVSLSLATGAVNWQANIDPPDNSNPSGITWSTESLSMEDRGALLVDGGRVFIPMGGNYGDCGGYHGYVVSYPEAGPGNGSLAWWASTEVNSGDSQGAIWATGGLSEDASGYIYAGTGNSDHGSSTDPYDYSDGVIKLNPSALAPGQPFDYFAPSHWYADNANDADLGSSTPLQLPGNRILQVGKSGLGYLLDSQNLGHIGGQLFEQRVCHATNDAAFGTLAYAGGLAFVGCSDGVAAVQIAANGDSFSALWYNTTDVANHPPTVAGGLVWSVSSGGNQLDGFSMSTGALERTLALTGSDHFTTATAANNQLYVGGGRYVDAFVGEGPPAPPTNVVATSAASGQATVSWTPSITSNVTGYLVTTYDSRRQAVGSAQSTSGSPLMVSGLTDGTPYYFGVAAVNPYADSAVAQSNSVTPLSGSAPPPAETAMSTHQYFLPNSDGSTWQVMDESALAFTMTPTSDETVLLGANSDLWTFDAGYNQDLGIQVTPGTGAPSVIAWKEAGGFGGTLSPNAAFVQTVYPMTSGVSYTLQVVWKTNRSAIGATIAAGAGPIGSAYSPTSLTAMVLPAGAYQSVVSTSQYPLANSDGTTWREMDAGQLATPNLSPSTDESVVLSGNADLWTADVGYNQDLGIFVSVNGATPTLVAWKESGGFAGTFSPNAAFVQAVYPLTKGDTYVFSLGWKTNRAAPGATIFAGAGPIGSAFSPTRLTDYILPASGGSSQWASVVSSAQYQLSGSDGTTWKPIDSSTLETAITVPSAGPAEMALVSGNADLWTATTGYNQDIGLYVSTDGGTSWTLLAWKESGGFAGTFSPNAAFVQNVFAMQPGTTYTFALVWKTNKPAAAATIFAGAGPWPSGSGSFSPTRLTVVPT